MADTRTVKENEVPDLIASGEFSFPTGQDVNVVNPAGKTVSLPSEQIKDALASGYKLETAFQGAVRSKVEEAGKSPIGTALKVFGAQAADEAAFGVPELIYDKTKSPFDVAVKEGLKKEYDTANTLGGITGFAGSLFLGGPLFKAGAKAGAAAAEVVGSRLAEAGIKRGAESLGADIVARTAENATRLGVEGAVLTAPRAISEAALGDPGAAAESLMMGGGIGIGLGVVAGPAGALFSRLNGFAKKKTAAALEASLENVGIKAEEGTIGKNAAGERFVPQDGAMPADDSLVEAARTEGASTGVLEDLKKLYGQKKANAPEIQAIASEAGIPVMDEMLSSNKTIQDFGSALSQKPTLTGINRASKYQKIYDWMDNTVKKSLGVEDFDKTKFEVGQTVRDQIFGPAREIKEKLGAVFNDLRMGYQDVPMDQKVLKQVAGNIETLGKRSFSPAAESTLNRVASQIKEGRIQNLNDLFEVRSLLYDLWGTDRTMNKAVGEVIKKLNLQEENQISRAIKERIESASVPGGKTLEDASRIQGLYDDVQKAKKQWAEMMDHFEETGDALGLGHIKDAASFLKKADSLTNEQVVDRLLPKNDVATLKFFAEKYPQQFKAVADLKKQTLLSDVVKDGKVQLGAFYRKVQAMPKEVQDALLGKEGVEGLRKSKVIFESIPKNVNPSGTAKTTAIMNMMNPGALVENLTDAAGSHVVSKVMSAEGLFGVESLMAKVGKKLNQIDESMLKSGGTSSTVKPLSIINTILGDDEKSKKKALEKLQDKISQTVGDPAGAADKVAHITSGLADGGAPKVAAAFGANLVRSLQYIQAAIPKRPVMGTSIYKMPYNPTDAEVSSFERKLAVVHDPFVALDALKNNTLTREHVEALAVNYPVIYQNMKQKILNVMSEEGVDVPYDKRVKLSLLMGLDLDPSISSQMVAGLQADHSQAAAMGAANEENDGLNQSGLMKLGKENPMQTPTQRMLARG